MVHEVDPSEFYSRLSISLAEDVDTSLLLLLSEALPKDVSWYSCPLPSMSAFFRLPNGTTQLLANVASVLDAVGSAAGRGCCDSAPAPKDPKGDARATWYDDVRRRFNSCDIPFDSGSDGDGGPPGIVGSPENGTVVNTGSVSAVVATAFTTPAELVTVASVGGRADDIRDVVDRRDARETGRSGDSVRGVAGLGDGPGGPSRGKVEGGGGGDRCD